jgi:hypothetical protein
MGDPPFPLEFRLHHPEVDHIHANRRVNAFDMRPKVAARF